jgi:hypothetical protein
MREEDSKQRLWMIFDNTLVLPEYLIEFEYKQSMQAISNDECDRLLVLLQKA